MQNRSKLPEWKQALIKLYLDHQARETPGAFKASGGYDQKINKYTDTNTNGLTRCVKDFLEFKGHYCIRTGRQGQARIERVPVGGTQRTIGGRGVIMAGKITYTKSAEGKAIADLHASINGLFIAIEIKCKATGDRFKAGSKQDENRKDVQDSGGIHIVVPSMEWFYTWYNTFINIK